jgi:hypothetical protein
MGIFGAAYAYKFRGAAQALVLTALGLTVAGISMTTLVRPGFGERWPRWAA